MPRCLGKGHMCLQQGPTSSVAVTQVGKAPDVAQPHAVAQAGQQELVLASPGLPGWVGGQDLRLVWGSWPGLAGGVGSRTLHLEDVDLWRGAKHHDPLAAACKTRKAPQQGWAWPSSC